MHYNKCHRLGVFFFLLMHVKIVHCQNGWSRPYPWIYWEIQNYSMQPNKCWSTINTIIITDYHIEGIFGNKLFHIAKTLCFPLKLTQLRTHGHWIFDKGRKLLGSQKYSLKKKTISRMFLKTTFQSLKLMTSLLWNSLQNLSPSWSSKILN